MCLSHLCTCQDLGQHPTPQRCSINSGECLNKTQLLIFRPLSANIHMFVRQEVQQVDLMSNWAIYVGGDVRDPTSLL